MCWSGRGRRSRRCARSSASCCRSRRWSGGSPTFIAGADIRYGSSPSSPLTGGFVPDLGELTHSGRPLLVDNTGTLAAVAAPWSDRVDVVIAPISGATAMLVRPDCYVAWASSSSQPDQDSLRAALTEWFG